MDMYNKEHYIDVPQTLAVMHVSAEEQKRKKLEREIELANITLLMPEIRKLAESRGLEIVNRIHFKGTRTEYIYK